jgi:CRISPR-associated exonuclease Cas4/CRISPR-associated protein Cas1
MTSDQLEIHLPTPPVTGETPLIPARMANEFVYCPRLAYLMWTQGEWRRHGRRTTHTFARRSSWRAVAGGAAKASELALARGRRSRDGGD